jgi:hypothetical protein
MVTLPAAARFEIDCSGHLVEPSSGYKSMQTKYQRKRDTEPAFGLHRQRPKVRPATDGALKLSDRTSDAEAFMLASKP